MDICLNSSLCQALLQVRVSIYSLQLECPLRLLYGPDQFISIYGLKFQSELIAILNFISEIIFPLLGLLRCPDQRLLSVEAILVTFCRKDVSNVAEGT